MQPTKLGRPQLWSDRVLSRTHSLQSKEHFAGAFRGSIQNEVFFTLGLVPFLLITFPASRTLLIGFGYTDVLVVREIDCGSWLAREYMPAHQHCGAAVTLLPRHDRTQSTIGFRINKVQLDSKSIPFGSTHGVRAHHIIVSFS